MAVRLPHGGWRHRNSLRRAFLELFGREKNVVPGDGWPCVLLAIRQDWRLARDLGLLAWASHGQAAVADEALDEQAAPLDVTLPETFP